MSGSGHAYKDIVIPDFVFKRIDYLSKRTGIPLEELLERYYTLFKDPWVQQDPQFKNDYERHTYVIKALWARVLARPPSREVVVIPFGYLEERISKSSGVPVSRIYVLQKVEGTNQWKKNVIVCKERQATLYQDVQLFSVYKVRVFDTGNILMATDDTKFTEPIQYINMDPVEFLEKAVGVKRFRLIEVHKHVSRRNGRFVDEFDLHGIDAIVLRYKIGQRPDGTKYAFYVVSDDSIGTEDVIDEEGKIIPAQFTIWVPSTMVKYDVDSELYFYGTVQVDAEGRPYMNAIGVLPIHAKRIQ